MMSKAAALTVNEGVDCRLSMYTTHNTQLMLYTYIQENQISKTDRAYRIFTD